MYEHHTPRDGVRRSEITLASVCFLFWLCFCKKLALNLPIWGDFFIVFCCFFGLTGRCESFEVLLFFLSRVVNRIPGLDVLFYNSASEQAMKNPSDITGVSLYILHLVLQSSKEQTVTATYRCKGFGWLIAI